MSKTDSRPIRVFVALTLIGLAFIAGLFQFLAHTTRERMILVGVLTLGGIVFTSAGVIGLLAVGLRRMFTAKQLK
jgi:hypothetical protein